MKTKKASASPETDKEQMPVAKAWEAWIEGRDPRDESMVVPADLARRLEQERDDAGGRRAGSGRQRGSSACSLADRS